MDIPEVKAFNSELSGLYDNKPPISKAKMSAITRGAVKAIKFYKHVVHSVEKFILKCKPEYKIPGLYVIDSIVRQSRHQFGPEKDVFAPRFAKNMQQTFINLLRCPPEDKRNIIRVLNLWQKNYVFSPEVIQPLFDMVNPNHPIHAELLAQQALAHANGSMSSMNADAKNSPAIVSQHTPTEPSHQEQGGKSDAAILAQLRQMQHLFRDSSSQQQGPPTASAQGDKSSVNFNRRLLNMDFEYESEDEGGGGGQLMSISMSSSAGQLTGGDSPAQQGSAPSAPAPLPQQLSQSAQQQQQQAAHSYLLNPLQAVNPNDALGSILTNPEILRQLQSLQAQMMVANFPQMQGMNNISIQQEMSYVDMSQPPPAIHNKQEESGKPSSPLMDEMNNESDIEFVDDAGPQVIEIDGNDSRSPSPKSMRRRRSRERSRRSRSRSRRASRSRSRERRARRGSRDREREKPRDREKDREKEKEKERDREKDRERMKKGLPPIKKDNISVCSTTLWVGHLSKLVQAEELSDTFGAIGDVVSIDLVPPRGCAFIVMNRRRDASRAITKLNKHKMHSKAITVAWAPGKGVKGREWKDYWEADAGACYVPWSRLPEGNEGLAVLDSLEEGGMLDEETVPAWLQRKISTLENKPKIQPELSAIPPAVLAAANTSGMMVVSPLQPPQNMTVEPGCLPPTLGALGFPAHPALPLPLPLLGFKPTPQSGLQQALHLQAVLAHHQQQQQMAAQLLLAPPPRLGPPLMQQPLSIIELRPDDPMEIDNTEEVPSQLDTHSKTGTPLSREDIQMTEKYKNMVSLPPPSFNIPPPSMLGKPPPTSSIPPPNSLIPPPHNSSIPPPNTKIPPPVTSQPPPTHGQPDQQNSQQGDGRDRDNKRDRDNGRRDRDRRDRDRDSGRRDSRHERDRDRDRDRVDRPERADRPDRSDRTDRPDRPDRPDRADRPDRPDRPERVERPDRVDRDRDRDRGDRDRDRDRGDRDRSTRDRGNRWAGRVDPRSASLERVEGPGGALAAAASERSLQDRLWEMANGPGQRPHRPDSPKHARIHPKEVLPQDGMMGEAPPSAALRPLSPPTPHGPPMVGRSPLLPPMAPFRIGREEMRMRGMGPRGPMDMSSMRPGMWIEGPVPPFGPRFGGGPTFNRPPFDGPPYDGPQYDGPPFDGPGPRFERPPFDREFDRPFDRSFDRAHFDGPGRPPFDRPGFDGPYDGPPFDGPPFDGPPHFDRPPFEGPPDAFFERGGPRGPRGVRGGESRRSRSDRDAERAPRSSRWAGRESPEKQANETDKYTDEKNEHIKDKTETHSESQKLSESPVKNIATEGNITQAVPVENGETRKSVDRESRNEKREPGKEEREPRKDEWESRKEERESKMEKREPRKGDWETRKDEREFRKEERESGIEESEYRRMEQEARSEEQEPRKEEPIIVEQEHRKEEPIIVEQEHKNEEQEYSKNEREHNNEIESRNDEHESTKENTQPTPRAIEESYPEEMMSVKESLSSVVLDKPAPTMEDAPCTSVDMERPEEGRGTPCRDEPPPGPETAADSP